MPGDVRDDRDRLPEFYLRPSVNGRPIEPEVHAALAQLWPWFWHYAAKELGDSCRAADLADEVASRVSKYIEARPQQVRSLGGLCRVTAINLVATAKTKERRIVYRGLGQDLEATLSPSSSSEQEDTELWILADQLLRGHDAETRLMLQRRLLGETWDQIGSSLGLSGGQARLRFLRAVERIRGVPKPNRGRP